MRYYKLGSRRKDKVVSLFLGRDVPDSSSDEVTDEEMLTGRTRCVMCISHLLPCRCSGHSCCRPRLWLGACCCRYSWLKMPIRLFVVIKA